MEEPLGILKRLCSHVTGVTDETTLSEQYRLSVGLLRSSLWSGSSMQGVRSVEEARAVGERIKKWLIRHDRLQHAVNFSQLFNNVMNSSVLKNKASILTLLLLLGQESEHQQPHPSNLQNCHPADAGDFFTLPPLYLGSAGHLSGGSSRATTGSSRSGSSPSVPTSEGDASGEGRDAVPRTGTTRTALLSSYCRGQRDGRGGGVRLPGAGERMGPHPQLLHGAHRPAPQVEVTEEVLVREVLFVLQGIEGKIIKYDVASDSYTIDPKVRISKPVRDLILKLSEVGWLYSQVHKFCENQHSRGAGLNKSASVGNISAPGGLLGRLSQSVSYSGLSSMQAPVGGALDTAGGRHASSSSPGPTLVNQALVLALRDHLNEHCRLIAVLEAQLGAVAEEGASEEGGGLTLRRLLLWTLEPRLRLRSLLHLTDSARGLRGGALLSALYQHVQHGAPSSEAVAQHCLARAAAPLHAMLTQWLLQGALTDPHQEFFIAADPTVSDHNLWHHKYSIRWCQLPSFVTPAEARQVLATGKSLNFLRSVCKLKAPMDEQDAIAAALQNTTVESLFSAERRGSLQQLMDVTYRAASGRVLHEVLEQQHLLQHLRALRRYLLLGQGDFIHMLLQVLRSELCQPANRLYPHNLSSLLETAVAASNARFDAPDTLRRLDVKLLQVAQGDTGWDVFSLDYHVDGPIGTVLTTECMQQYLMLFNSLWRAKHMECLLSDTWKQQAATTKLCRQLPEVQVVVHGVQLLLSEMIHLVHQLGYYMTFEVLEVSWDALMKALHRPDSLDCLITAHNTFLARIVKGALLDTHSTDVRTHLRSVYDLMLRLAELQTRLHSGVTAELAARRQKVHVEQAREAEGEFSTTAAEEQAEKQRRHAFSSRFVAKLKTELKILTQTYQDMVQSFLLMLAAHDDDNLQQLSGRLDFNEHYQRRDRRLRQRLTFHHKRKSLGGSKAAALVTDATDKSDALVC